MSGPSDLLLWGNKHTLTYFEVVKQNLSYVGSFGSLALGKLTYNGIFQVLNSNLVMLVVLGPDAKEKLTLKGIFTSV